jgi:hypothetical protein
MANWTPLREALSGVDDRRTFNWDELEALVGGLPRSAYVHSAFWKGRRASWAGFTTTDVHVGRSVTFVRRSTAERTGPFSRQTHPPLKLEGSDRRADVVLVSCVKSKLTHAAPARDLYVSDLFQKERAYAEAAGVPWFILSAEHGLVSPDEVIAPYELYLPKTSKEYQRAWGDRVMGQLVARLGSVEGLTIEVHASAAYVDAIRSGLHNAGAEVVDPLRGLAFGSRLAWYGRARNSARTEASTPAVEVADLASQLGTEAVAMPPSEFVASRGDGWRTPGLYSWWVDAAGAADLSQGLGHEIEPGLIYAGLAGATRSRSGRKSTNTLWGRINGMHLGGRHDFSTFRLSLGSVLANARGDAEIDEDHLTQWMHQHLRLIAVPVDDADALDGLETALLRDIEPPLNLDKMPRSQIRAELTELRRRYGRRRRSR